MANEYSGKPTIEKASPPTQSKKPSPKHKFEGHKELIWSFVFLHDNEHIVSGSLDGTMRKWDCKTGLLVGEPWEGEGGKIWALALSPNGNIIACGRDDGSVQQWNTDGKTIKGVWVDHDKQVLSLSWSPGGSHVASGFQDGIILIRKAENGKVEVGPIKTEQDGVWSLAYSPSGDRIASGGDNTICIWDSNTGQLLVGPIKGLGGYGAYVSSVVWSSDSSKLYSASDKFARVFDSVSGTELHRFEHNHYLLSVALSPKHNVLACVGSEGIAQLWDTESYQPLGKPLSLEDNVALQCVSFSRDGRYLAYSGNDTKITLWMVKDVAPALPDTRSQLDADTTRRKPVAHFAGDGRDDFYRDFFQSSRRPPQLGSYRPSRPSERPHPPPAHFWSILIPSRHHHGADGSVPLQEHPTRRFFARRPHSNSPLWMPASTSSTTATSDGTKAPEVEQHTVDPLDFVHAPLVTRNTIDGKGKQRSEAAENTQSLSLDAPAPSPKFDSSLKSPLHSLGNNPTSLSYRRRYATSPEVVEVPVARGFQRLVARKRKHKTQSKPAAPVGSASSMAATSSQAVSAPIPHASGSSLAGASSQDGPAQAATSSQHAGGSPSHIVETHDTRDDSDSDSDSSIQGSWNKFLARLCFPRGRYQDDRH